MSEDWYNKTEKNGLYSQLNFIKYNLFFHRRFAINLSLLRDSKNYEHNNIKQHIIYSSKNYQKVSDIVKLNELKTKHPTILLKKSLKYHI
jgi:hypothetical protein